MLKEQHRIRRSELELPPRAIKKEIVISEANDLAVVIEDGRASEFVMRQGEQLVGDIILGKVESVVPAIEAAFINIGHEKNGFIHVADLPPSPSAKKKGKVPIVRSGDKLIVQIAKAPTGTKGARLTGRISVPGRYLVFVPHDNRVCISRRIVDSKERERLRRIAFNLKDPGHGLIVRTEAIGASEDELRRDIDELIDRWAEILHVAQVRHAPALLYRDHDLMTRVLRDALSADTEKIVLDSVEGLQRASDLLSGWMPEMVKNLQLHGGKDTVMNHYKIYGEIENALKPTIRLPSGGSIVIEPTEALTVIDVNSGRLTNSKSLQDTVLRTNLEAATEIARQLRLRDIGGVVIIDFISMDFPADRQKVIRHFEEALRPDKSRPQITSQFSEHGLLEVARRRQGQTLLEQMTRACPHCHGVGRVRNDVFATTAVEGAAITAAVGDEPEAIVEELLEEPLATEILDSEVEPGSVANGGGRMPFGRERRPAPELAAPRPEYIESDAEGGEFETEAGGEAEPSRRRRRRRRRRGGRGAEGEGRAPFEGAQRPAEGDLFELPAEEGFDEFEASPEDIAVYAHDTGAAEGDAEAGGHRRRRRRRGRGGREGMAERPLEPVAQPSGFGRLERPRQMGPVPGSGFGHRTEAAGERPAFERTEVATARPRFEGAAVGERRAVRPEREVAVVEAEPTPVPAAVTEQPAGEAQGPAKRLPKGVTGFRPIVGPVERTAPYTPKAAAGRPRMEIREVAPGVMQLVPVESEPGAPAASPAAEAEAPVKRTRRTAVRKAGSAEAAEVAQAVEAAKAEAASAGLEAAPGSGSAAAKPSEAKAAEPAKGTRGRTGASTRAKAGSRTRKSAE